MKKWAIIVLAGTVAVTFARRAGGKAAAAKQPKHPTPTPAASIDPGIVVRVPFNGDPGMAVHSPFNGDPGIVAGGKRPHGGAASPQDATTAAQQGDDAQPAQDHHLV